MTTTIFQRRGAEAQVNTYTIDGQFLPSVAALGDGGYVVAWTSSNQDGSGNGIYAQRYDASGVAQGVEFLINTFTAGNQYEPYVAALADGGYIVTWTSEGQDGSASGLYAQRYDASGAAQGGEVRVNTFTAGEQFWPSVAALSDGGYVVTWMSDGQDGSSWGVYAQRYDASGAAQGSEVQVNTYTSGGQFAPIVAALADGGYLVAWTSLDQDGSSNGIYAQRYDALGAAQGGEVRVNTYTTGNQANPSIATLADGGYVITWTSEHQDGSTYGVYAQRFDASSVAQGGEVQVNTQTDSVQYQPWVAALADGGYVVTWLSQGQDGSGNGIYAQRYDASGVAQGGEELVNSYTSGDQSNPAIAALADGGYVVSWDSYGQDGSGLGVYSQRYGPTITGTEDDDIIIGTALVDLIDGLGGNDTVTGDAGSDTLDGGDGDDYLDGGLGNDTLIGGAGNDALFDSDGVNSFDGGDGDDGLASYSGEAGQMMSGGAGNDYLYANGGSTLSGGDGDDILVSNGGNSTLSGGAGNDDLSARGGNSTLFGGDGDDVLTGGWGGDDLIDGGEGSDTVSYFTAGGSVIVDVEGTADGFATGAAGNDTLRSIENIIGSEYDDELYGDEGNNRLFGGAGNDFLVGGPGNDQLEGGDGSDLMLGNDGDDTMIGGAGDDNLVGHEGNDFSDGGEGNDILRSGTGDDFLDGGEGVDSAVYTDAPSGVVVDLAAGIASGGNGNDTLVNVEEVVGSPFDDQLTGDSGNNYLGGMAGNDSVHGGDGDDVLTGDEGDDFIDGGTGNDMAFGGAGDDTISGGAGNDTLDGGDGIDTASYADAAGPIDLNLGAGVADEYDAGGSIVVSQDTLAGIENVIGSAFDDTIAGSGGSNRIFGGAGNDFILAGGGDDYVEGGDGNDFVIGNQGDDIIIGGDGHDGLNGFQGNDALVGGLGNDALRGGSGDDVVDGGDGFDRAIYTWLSPTASDQPPGGVTVSLMLQGVAQNTGHGWDTLIGIEALSGTLFDDHFTGDNQINWLIAYGANDTLLGNGGDDLLEARSVGNHILNGGAGIDTVSFTDFFVDQPITSGVTVSLALQGAAQNTGAGMMTLTQIENLSGTRLDDQLTGDGAANVLAGNAGNDVLSGDAGNDVLYGDGVIAASIAGTDGPPRTLENIASGNDRLDGGKGDDVLFGGGGDDLLTGGSGIDKYVFGVGSGHDLITDYAKGELIIISGVAGVDDISDLTIAPGAGGAVISWGTGDTVTLAGYKAGKLTAADFAFSPASIVAGAVAAAGLISAPASAVKILATADDVNLVPAAPALSFKKMDAGVLDAVESDRPALTAETHESLQGVAIELVTAGKTLAENAFTVGHATTPASLTELLQGTDASAYSVNSLVAQGVAMPSAEILQSVAEVAQMTGEVARVLADVLSGAGGMPHSLDALLEALPGTANSEGAGLGVSASNGAADAGSSDTGNFAIFSSANFAFSDALAFHHDASPAV